MNTKGGDLDAVMAREGSQECEKGLTYVGNKLVLPAPFLLTTWTAGICGVRLGKVAAAFR